MGGRKNGYGYNEYNGRGGGRVRAALLFIIALLAVLLAAGVGFMAFMGEYLEYTENGVIVHWPWAQESAPPLPIASDPIEVVTDPVDVTEAPTLEVDPTLTPVPELQYGPIGAVTVTTGQLRNGTAAQAVLAAGGGALVVQMKDMNGRLAWRSQTELAASLGTNADDDLTAQAVKALADAGHFYLVARISCFRDATLARNWVGSLMTRGGNVWHDTQGLGWTSPASQQAADYLSALCQELADMGFEEILLDDAGYPNFGEVNVLATSDNRPADLTVPVSAFLERISGELGSRGVCVSVFTDETLSPGDAVLTGLTADVLARHAGRVWLDWGVSRDQYTALLTAAGFDNTDARIVTPGGSGGSWYR